MPTFRYYRLDHQGRIIAGDYIETDDLSSAIELVREVCRGDARAGFDQIEIWQDTSLVYGDPALPRKWPPGTSSDMSGEL
jgi:hypothetical protein